MQLLETVYQDSRRGVDHAAGVIRGVKVLGKVSKYTNGQVRHTYSENALRQAASHYQDIVVHLDHPPRSTPDKERSILDRIGVLRNPLVKADGVYADLHYIKAHSAAPVISEMAERFPHTFGLSHNADGKDRKVNGETIIESVTSVRSVDIVGRPATNRGIFESSRDQPLTLTRANVRQATAIAKEVNYLAEQVQAWIRRQREITNTTTESFVTSITKG